jgi:hypothetical protein
VDSKSFLALDIGDEEARKMLPFVATLCHFATARVPTVSPVDSKSFLALDIGDEEARKMLPFVATLCHFATAPVPTVLDLGKVIFGFGDR